MKLISGVFEGIVGYEWAGVIQGNLSIQTVHDRAFILVDGEYSGVGF